LTRTLARLCTLLLASAVSGLLGWTLYPESDRPPSSSLEPVYFLVGLPESRASAVFNSTVTLMSDGSTTVRVGVVMIRHSGDVKDDRVAPPFHVAVAYLPEFEASLASQANMSEAMVGLAKHPLVKFEGHKVLSLEVSSRVTPRIRRLDTVPGIFTLRFSGQPWTARRGTWLHARTSIIEDRDVGEADVPRTRIRGHQTICLPEDMSDYVLVRGPTPTAALDPSEESCASWNGVQSFDVMLRSAVGQDQRDREIFLGGLLLGVASGGGLALIDRVFDLGPMRQPADPTRNSAMQPTSTGARRSRPADVARKKRSPSRVSARLPLGRHRR
jgi:hypothetical protein